jgi:hypothetical protein
MKRKSLSTLILIYFNFFLIFAFCLIVGSASLSSSHKLAKSLSEIHSNGVPILLTKPEALINNKQTKRISSNHTIQYLLDSFSNESYITDKIKTINSHHSTQYLLLNESMNFTASSYQLDLPFYTVLIPTIMYIFIFLIGFFGNALVIIVVCCNKSLQHNTNYCLVNLSVADLLLILVCMPSAIVDLYAKEVWYFGYILCK